MKKYLSRKFLMALFVLVLTSVAPFVYKHNDVSDTITLAVLGIISAVGVAYGIINVKDAKEKLGPPKASK